MPKLIIGNCGNENMVGSQERMGQRLRDKRSIVAHRLLWLMEDDDIAIMPYRVDPAFLKYMNGLLGTNLSTDQIILPQGAEKSTHLLTFGEISEQSLVVQLKQKVNETFIPVPYYFDRSIGWLTEQLHLSLDETTLGFFRQGGAEMFNSKRDFRRLAAGAQIPIAPGFICSSSLELLHAVNELLPKSQRVIVKQDLNAGGTGNVVLTLANEDSSLGAAKTIRLSDETEVENLVESLWLELTDERNSVIVVEAYYPNSRSYYSELEVPQIGSSTLLNFGEMRMEPVWVGFDIPGNNLSAYQLGNFAAASAQLADLAQRTGYRGKINCDAIITEDQQVIFTEFNGRLGGCTHIHEAAVRLFGSDYGNRLTVLTRNSVRSPAFIEAITTLQSAGLLANADHEAGVIILTEDTARSGTLEYMVVASNRTSAELIEQQVLAILEQALTSKEKAGVA